MLPLPSDTRKALGLAEDAKSAGAASGCESRSLLADRYANPQLKEGERNEFFNAVARRRPRSEKMNAWRAFLAADLKLESQQIRLAQLQSRLMVNMAGSVMENAGLCLDRFGVPFIPGSAVKGCARRMAIECLANLGTSGSSATIAERAALLADIALVFGWGDTDWTAGRKRKNGKPTEPRSDFWWAMARDSGDHSSDPQRDSLWMEVSKAATNMIHCSSNEKAGEFGVSRGHQPLNFGGAVAFLPAYPPDLPANDITLDVVTCHHPDYYGRKKDEKGQLRMPIALDSEQRIIPIVFPAVAAGVVFQFIVLPLRGVRESRSRPGMSLHALAQTWLWDGLVGFGLGAKTAAGYGWFAEVATAAPPKSQADRIPVTAQKPASVPLIPKPSVPAEHPLIAQWRDRTQPANFRVFRPLWAAIQDTEELKRVFNAVIPQNELQRLRNNNPYWQSFRSHPDGQAILQRLGITLR